MSFAFASERLADVRQDAQRLRDGARDHDVQLEALVVAGEGGHVGRLRLPPPREPLTSTRIGGVTVAVKSGTPLDAGPGRAEAVDGDERGRTRT